MGGNILTPVVGVAFTPVYLQFLEAQRREAELYNLMNWMPAVRAASIERGYRPSTFATARWLAAKQVAVKSQIALTRRGRLTDEAKN